MYKQIILSNPKYGVTGNFNIEKKYYDMHYSMHKIRPEEALQSNLTSCYGKDVDIIPKMIKEVILNEYNMASSLNLLLQKLEKNMISYEKR